MSEKGKQGTREDEFEFFDTSLSFCWLGSLPLMGVFFFTPNDMVVSVFFCGSGEVGRLLPPSCVVHWCARAELQDKHPVLDAEGTHGDFLYFQKYKP